MLLGTFVGMYVSVSRVDNCIRTFQAARVAWIPHCSPRVDTVGGKNTATPAAFAFFDEFRPTSNFGRNFRLLWIFGIFIFFVNFRCFLMILLLNFDVHHSAGHLGWGRKGIALFFQSVAILFPPTVLLGFFNDGSV